MRTRRIIYIPSLPRHCSRYIFRLNDSHYADHTSMTDKSYQYGCVHFPLCNPYHWNHRYLVLFFMVLVNFQSYFVYDNPVALQRTIINVSVILKLSQSACSVKPVFSPLIICQVMEVDVTQYSLLYSIYAWPNIVLAFCGGYLLDRVFGVRLGTVIFSSLVCLGQVSHLCQNLWIDVYFNMGVFNSTMLYHHYTCSILLKSSLVTKSGSLILQNKGYKRLALACHTLLTGCVTFGYTAFDQFLLSFC